MDDHGIVIGDPMYEDKPDFHVVSRDGFRASKSPNGRKLMKLLASYLQEGE